MQFCQTVRDIATLVGDWNYYDEQFRYLHKGNPPKYPWGVVHWELWGHAMTLRAKSRYFVTASPAWGSRENNQGSEGCVSRSTPDVPRWPADTTITAQNVVVDMQQHPANPPQTFPNQPETELSQLPHIINSPPITTVKVSTLSPLLHQYYPRLKGFLIDGFSFGFRVGFAGNS